LYDARSFPIDSTRDCSVVTIVSFKKIEYPVALLP